jgi:hypothetical protein
MWGRYHDRVDILSLDGIAKICRRTRTDRPGQFESAGS